MPDATFTSPDLTTFTRLDPSLKVPQAVFEDCTRDLATATDRILRKHGRTIIDKQFATRRLGDIMIDLWVENQPR